MDIELISTEDLINELLKRYDATVFIGVRHNYEGKLVDNYTTRWKGPISTIRGLIEILRDYTVDMTEQMMEDGADCEDI